MDTDRIKAALEGLVEGKKSGVFFCDCEAKDTEELESKVQDTQERWHEAEEALSLLSAPSPVGQEARELAEKIREYTMTGRYESIFEFDLSANDAASLIQSALEAAVAGERERVERLQTLAKKANEALYDALECKPGCAPATKRAWQAFDELHMAIKEAKR